MSNIEKTVASLEEAAMQVSSPRRDGLLLYAKVLPVIAAWERKTIEENSDWSRDMYINATLIGLVMMATSLVRGVTHDLGEKAMLEVGAFVTSHFSTGLQHSLMGATADPKAAAAAFLNLQGVRLPKVEELTVGQLEAAEQAYLDLCVQTPVGSLDPKQVVLAIIEAIHRSEVEKQTGEKQS